MSFTPIKSVSITMPNPEVEFKKLFDENLKDKNVKEKIVALFERICDQNIESFEFQRKENFTRVNLKLHKQIKKITSQSTTLYIPKQLEFNINNDDSIEFCDENHNSGKNCPWEDCTNSWVVKSNYIWWLINVKEENLELTCPLEVGIFFTFAGGTPNVRNVNAQIFTNSLN